MPCKELHEKIDKLNEVIKNQDDAISDMMKDNHKILQDLNKLSNNYTNLLKKYTDLKSKKRHGLLVVYDENNEKFFDIMEDLNQLVHGKIPVKMFLTFTLDELNKWISTVSSINKKVIKND